MELDVIKLHTTWNDAAGSLNTNFAKLKTAIASLQEGSGGLNEEELLAFLVANGYATEEDIEERINELVNGAPEALDTLKEIADALADDDDAIAGIVTSLYELRSRLEKAEEITSLFGVDEHGIYTDENFRSSKEISAGGAAEEGEEGEGGTTTGEYKMYHHSQGIAAKEWRVEHGLGKYPNVRIVDSNRELCFGDVKYINDSVLTITFGAAFAGDAYCD